MYYKILPKRGLKVDLPILTAGEIAVTLDANKQDIYVGDGTNNFNLTQKEKVDKLALDLQGIENITAIGNDIIIKKATGSATTITVPISGALIDGYPLNFIPSANNLGNPTTLNGKNLYKQGTLIAPNLKTTRVASVYYSLSGDCFFIVASAEGNSDISNVLAGKSFSNDNDTGLIGTMVDQGAKIFDITTSNQNIPEGYHNGVGYVKGYPDLLPINVAKDKIIGNVVGTYDPLLLVAGTSQLLYDDTRSNGSASTTFVKMREFTVTNGHGNVTVSFKMNGNNYAVYGKIFKNGLEVGTLRTMTSTNPVVYSENFDIKEGDLIQLYAYTSQSGYTVVITDFSVTCGNKNALLTKIL